MQSTKKAEACGQIDAERIAAVDALKFKSEHLRKVLELHKAAPSAATTELLGLAETGAVAYDVIMRAKATAFGQKT